MVLNQSSLSMWHPPTSESWCCTCHHCWPRPDPTKVWDIDLHCPWKPPEKTQLSKEPIWNSLLLPGMAWPTCPTNRCLGLPRVTKLPQTRHAAASEVYFRSVLMIYWLELLHQTPVHADLFGKEMHQWTTTGSTLPPLPHHMSSPNTK